ncbi:aminopeptidase P N-terminal domain-containing protein [Candidatus Gracilibacteria bacterium]|nr:aminopeptidase P N-terminal domain-containing protein [Candidatus Gracilibacteria bacterium]
MNSYLTALIAELPSDHLITITGAIAPLRNGDVHYPFRQDSDFLYLTGLSVPGLILTIFSDQIILWREAITDLDRVWGSDKISDNEIVRIAGIVDIRDRSDLELYRSGKKETNDDAVRDIIHSLRLIKTPDEIEKIRQAISISQEAFSHIESILQPGMYEYEIEAEVARIFRSHHLTEAYPSIVASGPNSCVLHYSAHMRQLEEGDLVLIDAGAEYMGYASDMTRTFAVSGFAPRQLAVYEAVDRVKKIAENTLSPGISLTEYEQIVRVAMNEELTNLGLIPPDATEDEVAKLSRKYYPHRTSHFLGLDVHDVGPRDTLLVPGMVLTIEPGIYISDEQIGFRIEDDYLITETGCEKLS